MPRAKMARPVTGCLTPRSWKEGAEPEPDPTIPQQEEQPDATEGKDKVD